MKTWVPQHQMTEELADVARWVVQINGLPYAATAVRFACD
jgi:hypothetical protein